MTTYETFFVATDEELDALFPGWKAPGRTKRKHVRSDPYRGTVEAIETVEPEEEPGCLGKPSFLDDVWGPPVPPVEPALDAAHRKLQAGGAPGLLARPHYRTKNASRLVYGASFVQLMRGTEEPRERPPLRLGADEDLDVPRVFGWSTRHTRALAICDDARLDELAGELLLEDGDEDEIEVDVRVLTQMTTDLRAVRALARQAIERGARLCIYLTMRR